MNECFDSHLRLTQYADVLFCNIIVIFDCHVKDTTDMTPPCAEARSNFWDTYGSYVENIVCWAPRARWKIGNRKSFVNNDDRAKAAHSPKIVIELEWK